MEKVENRICKTCWEEFLPRWPIQVDCKKCLRERIDMLTEKLVEHWRIYREWNAIVAEDKNKQKVSIDFQE
jgi:hypothetical protein